MKKKNQEQPSELGESTKLVGTWICRTCGEIVSDLIDGCCPMSDCGSDDVESLSPEEAEEYLLNKELETSLRL